MTARSRMTHRCTVQRGTSTTDPFGSQTPPTWANHIEPLACWIWNRSLVRTGGESVTENRTAIIDDLRMLVPERADVTELDRIVNVRDRQGNVFEAGPLNVRGVLKKPTHYELVLQRVS